METHAHNARFIITGNYKHKITKPIQSRCQSLDIKPDIKDCMKRCLSILKSENVNVSEDQKKKLAVLVRKYFPDLRKCINEMQKATINNNLSIGEGPNVNKVCEEIFEAINSKDTLKIRKKLIQEDGLFGSDWDQLLIDLLNFVYVHEGLDDSKKKAMILIIADHLEKSSRVIDKEINTFSCILNLEEVLS